MSSEALAPSLEDKTSSKTFGPYLGQMAMVRFEDTFYLVLSDDLKTDLASKIDHKKSSQDCEFRRGSAQIFQFDDLTKSKSVEGQLFKFKTGAELRAFLGFNDREPSTNSISLKDIMGSDFHLAPGAKTHFFDTVTQAQAEMASGELQKIVPVVFEYASLNPERFVECASTLTEKLLIRCEDSSFEGSYPYAYIDFERKTGVWGITPEILWSQRGNQLKTMAVAGTYHSAHLMTREEFVRDTKETQEHRLVILDIVQKLEGYGPISIGPTHLKQTGKLEHLVTPIELNRTAPEADWNALLHPTAALGVYPSTQRERWLSRLAESGRTHFGAPICFDLGDRQVALVAIRQISVSQSVVRIGAGCGVVAQSVAEKEWIEIAQKREAIRRIFLT